MCLLEERDSNFAGDNTKIRFIGRLEELVEGSFLLRGEIEVGMSCSGESGCARQTSDH
jgi:hypothetical protein